MTPIDGYVKAGNGEDTLYYAGRTFSPNSSIGRNNHSLLLKTNAVAWGMAVMNVAVEYDISPAISVLIPFYYSPCNTISNRSPLRNLLNLCTELPDKGKEVKHAKGGST